MQINLCSQFMKQYEAGTPVSSDRDLATAMDENNNVMFFSIGSDGHLYLFQKDSGTPTGWRRTNLSADIGDQVNVTHIATAQDNDGKPILAAAVEDLKFPNNPRLYFTKNFSPEKTSNRWVFRGNQPGIEITHIATGGNKQGNVIIVISTQKDNKMTNYLVNPDLTDKSWLWREIPVPLNGKGVINLAVGHNKKFEQIDGVDAILYTLLTIDDQTTKVVITSLPDFSFYNHEIPIDFSPTALSIIADSHGNSELFLATDQLYNLDIQAQTSRDKSDLTQDIISIGKQKLTHTAKKIINGRYVNGTLEAWILTKDGNLYFTQEQENNGWLEPYPLDKEIGQITAWRNPHNNAIDLFTVNINNQLHHLWQDLTTTRWKEHQIMLGGVNNSIEYDSYTSQIIISDDNGSALADKTFKVSASELTMVAINGNKYFVDGQTDIATVKTDATGSIVVTNKVNNMTSPIIRLEADFLDKAIDLNPNEHIAEQLTQMSADDWKNAQLQTDEDGVTKPLFANPDKVDFTGTHQAVQQLVNLQHKLPSKQGEINATIPQTTLDQEGVIVAAKNSAISHQIDLKSIPDGYNWGLDLTGKNPVFSNKKDYIQANYMATYNRKKAAPQSFVGGFFGNIEHAFGDVWQAIKHGFIKVTHLVVQKVKEGIKIVINGLEDAVHVIVQYAEQVWQVVEMVFNKIGVFFKDLILWLGYIFKWKDIVRTHDVLRNLTNQSLDYAIDQIEETEVKIKDFFEQIEQKLANEDLGSKLGDNGKQSLSGIGKQANNTTIHKKPQANWSFNHMSHGNFNSSSPVAKLDFSGHSLGDIFKDFGENEVKILETAFEAIVEDILKGFETLSIVDMFRKLSVALSEAVLETVENGAISMLRLTEFSIRAFKVILNAEWNIPLITPLYKILTGRKPSLLDLSCLLVAIPSTILYKITTGSTPFSSNEAKKLANAQSYQELTKIWTTSSDVKVLSLNAVNQASSTTSMMSSQEDEDDNNRSNAQKATDILAITLFCSRTAAAIADSFKTNAAFIDDEIDAFNSSTLWTGIKAGFDFISFAQSLTTNSISINSSSDSKTRRGIELGLTLVQLIFPVRDAAYVVYSRMTKEKPPEVVKFAIALVECGVGILVLGGVIFVLVDELENDEDKADSSLKFLQNVSSSTRRIISPLGDIPTKNISDPKVKAALKVTKQTAKVTRTTLLYIRALFNLVRGITDASRGITFADY